MNDQMINTTLFCANHPTIETSLRCKRCEKPICPKCAIATPTGYICKECERVQQKSFDTALGKDYIFACIITIILSILCSLIIPTLGFFVIFLSPMVGIIIAEVVKASTQKRRSMWLFRIVLISACVGSLPMLIMSMITGNWLGVLIQGFYSVTVAVTAYQRLKGISI